jgi:hypothetical protein
MCSFTPSIQLVTYTAHCNSQPSTYQCFITKRHWIHKPFQLSLNHKQICANLLQQHARKKIFIAWKYSHGHKEEQCTRAQFWGLTNGLSLCDPSLKSPVATAVVWSPLASLSKSFLYCQVQWESLSLPSVH